jgi:outer membrane protein OmpA-like peptidoglycan-associated protein
MGGYDIFKTVLNRESMTWSEPENLGYPINSAEDDIYFVLSGHGKTAYYSSEHKNGFGLHDIYKINFLKDDEILASSVKEEHLTEVVADSIIVEEVISNKKLLVGESVDSRSKQPVKVHITVRDLHTHLIIAEGNSSYVTGKYEIEVPLSTQGVTIEVTSPGYLFSIDEYEFKDSKKIEPKIEMIQVKKGAALKLNNMRFSTIIKELSEETHTLLQIVFDLLTDNPTLEIEIGGHTDNTGSESYNIKLSTKRAKAVVDYLIEHEIEESRLEFKGYGSEVPVGDNDSEIGRTKNRRTELTVTKI